MDEDQLKRLSEVIEYADEIELLFGELHQLRSQLKDAEEVIRSVEQHRKEVDDCPLIFDNAYYLMKAFKHDNEPWRKALDNYRKKWSDGDG